MADFRDGMPTFIRHFFRVDPPLQLSQSYALSWLEQAHLRALAADSSSAVDATELRQRFAQIAEGIRQIETRGSWCQDFDQKHEYLRTLYPAEEPRGVCVGRRLSHYNQVVQGIFQQLYPDEQALPQQLIHVSCTGYVSPSPAQRLVAQRRADCAVTHLYHMGCGASLPALRLATALVRARGEGSRVDCAHTELCTFHLDPGSHDLAQLVIQALFADGAIRYAVEEQEQRPHGSLMVGRMDEQIVPGSAEAMTWEVRPWAFAMSLAKTVPVLIRRALPDFLQRLVGHEEELKQLLRQAIWAIHPGGPKIVDQIGDALGLMDWQMTHSRAVLRQHGNMSSATLPHIWHSILTDPLVPTGTPIVSLAFSPGLTLAGVLLRKV
jgi:predicted naringenin-chalcone synthase